MQVLQGAHHQGSGILGFLSTDDAVPVRVACKELRDCVANFTWASMNRVPGGLRLWRTCFPRAIAANILDRPDLVDADFVHLRGIHTLNMSRCRQPGITDAAFVSLRGIRMNLVESNAARMLPNPALPKLEIFVPGIGPHVKDMAFAKNPQGQGRAFFYTDSFGRGWIPFLGYEFGEADLRSRA